MTELIVKNEKVELISTPHSDELLGRLRDISRFLKINIKKFPQSTPPSNLVTISAAAILSRVFVFVW